MQMNGRRVGGAVVGSIVLKLRLTCGLGDFSLPGTLLNLTLFSAFPIMGFILGLIRGCRKKRNAKGYGDMNVGSSVLPMMFWNLSCAGEITLSVARSAKLMTYNGVKKAREVVSY